MKLWSAIIKGSKTSKQAFGSWINKDGSSCALGAACIGLGIKSYDPTGYEQIGQLTALFPFITRKDIKCPCNKKVNGCKSVWQFSGLIAHLNDHHYWSRERIAKWIKSVESKLSSTEKRRG